MDPLSFESFRLSTNSSSKCLSRTSILLPLTFNTSVSSSKVSNIAFNGEWAIHLPPYHSFPLWVNGLVSSGSLTNLSSTSSVVCFSKSTHLPKANFNLFSRFSFLNKLLGLNLTFKLDTQIPVP